MEGGSPPGRASISSRLGSQPFRRRGGARAGAGAETGSGVGVGRGVAGSAAAHRKLTAEVVADLGAGPEAVEAWTKARGAPLVRIRDAVDAISASGLTVSKATVAANLLGDLGRAD